MVVLKKDLLVLKEPTILEKEAIYEMIEEIKSYDNNFEGLSNIKDITNYEEWLEKTENNKYQEKIKEKYSPQTTYLAIDMNGEIVGGINIRHVLKGDLINHGGNIGYLIRPSKRGCGYGSIMLSLALEKCRELGLEKVLITCREENIASAKVMINNGGIYENNYYDKELDISYRRYWIDISNQFMTSKKK